MNSTGPEPSVFPPVLPKAGASKQTKWTVLLLFLVVCGTPTLGLYWSRQYYRVFQIPSESMEPAIMHGDHILVDMRYFRTHVPARGEIVVFRRHELLLLKRVVALPGDTIEGRNGVTYLNGSAISEPYVQLLDPDQITNFLQSFGPITLKKGECFVMGDNRANSLDSRAPDFGPISITTIVGRPLYVLVSEKPGRAWERIQ